MIKEDSILQARFKGGGSIVTLPPVFSEDAEFVYVAWKNEVLSYSTKTSKKICEFKGLQHVLGFGYVSTETDEYVIACANNGKIIIWKARNALKLKELKIKLDKHAKLKYFKVFYENNDNSPCVKSLVCIENLTTHMYEFSLLNLDTGLLKPQSKLKIIEQDRSNILIDVSGQGKYFVVTQGQHMYYIPFGSRWIRHSIKGRTFTCIACHPYERAILTGDNTGRILLWNNITSKNPAQAVYHWHTLPAETVCFSTSGTYFYSGAGECVLVKWSQENNNLKQFLPRLPAPIKHICVARDNVLIAVATDDNGVQIISPQLNVLSVIQHLALGNNTSAGIIFDSRSKTLLLNGVIGHIQLFSPKDMNLAYSLDVVGQNKLTHERDKNMISTVVAKVALNRSGLWMATIEHRCDPEMFECRLKFWSFDVVQQLFSLNTSIEYPHEDFVKDIVFQPSQNDSDVLCVTIGEDKKFKVWQLVNSSTIYYERHSWRCSGEVTYRDLQPHAVTFSSDGSLISVGFDSIITTWLSDIHELKCSLRHPLQDDNITHLSFGTGSECHLLFSATATYVSVWNLLSLSMLWTVRVDVLLVVPDVSTSLKAVFTKDKKIFIVDIKSPTPIYASSNILKNVGDIQAATFVPKASINSDIGLIWYRRSCIYILDSNYELYSIETKDEESNIDLHIEDGNMTLYSHLLPKIKADAVTVPNREHMYQKGDPSKAFSKFLDTPPHSMAPLHLSCEGILESMILACNYDKQNMDTNNPVSSKEQNETEEKERREDKKEINLSKVKRESTAWISIF